MKDSVIINATFIRETKDAIQLDCEGDKVWFSKSLIEFDREDESLEMPTWLYKQKFPNG